MEALREAVRHAGGVLETIAPVVGGVVLTDGSTLLADQMIDGGPSVLYDAVALLPSTGVANWLAGQSTAKDFVADAFAHHKFIGYTTKALPLLVAAGVADAIEPGCVKITRSSVAKFVRVCGAMQYWDRAVQP